VKTKSVKHLKAGLLIGLLMSSLIAIGQAVASDYLGIVQIDCNGWIAKYTGAHILNRDNTGAGREKLSITATDGGGKVIYSAVFTNKLTTYTDGIGDRPWTSPPQYNPITWTLTSLAGNGFAEHLDFAATGSCAGLPTLFVPCGLDGRLNDDPSKDCAAPVAIYADPLRIYAIDPQSGVGQMAIELTGGEVDMVGIPAENTLLKHAHNPYSGQEISIYRLTTGEFQVNTTYADGKSYIVVWNTEGTLYHIAS